MIFHTANKNGETLDLMIDNVKIDRVRELNFLGLTINENLNWKSHINKISNKVSLILSHLNFDILVWGYECEHIIKLQKKLLQ